MLTRERNIRPPQDVPSGNFTSQSCSDGKEMYQTSVRHVKSCFGDKAYWFFDVDGSPFRRRRRCQSSLKAGTTTTSTNT